MFVQINNANEFFTCKINSFYGSLTMSDENPNRIQLAIYGYLRDFVIDNSLSNIFPDQLKDVIIMLYPRNRFKFMGKFKGSEAKIENDGAKLMKMDDGKWCHCQIGDFFDIDHKLIHKITLKTFDNDESITGFNGIGFVTRQCALIDYDTGADGSIYLSSNGYFTTSKCFDEKMMNDGTFIRENEHAIENNGGWYEDNDLLMIKIDTSKMKAIAWNSTPPIDKAQDRTDMNVDTEYKDYEGFYFQFDLPKDIPVALFIRLYRKQTVEIVDHVIEYIK